MTWLGKPKPTKDCKVNGGGEEEEEEEEEKLYSKTNQYSGNEGKNLWFHKGKLSTA